MSKLLTQVIAHTGTGSVAGLLTGMRHIHGFTAINDDTAAVAQVIIYNATAATSNPVIQIRTNTADGSNFEESFGVLFAYPIKCANGVSIAATADAVVLVYYS